jgi:hypothetical protein
LLIGQTKEAMKPEDILMMLDGIKQEEGAIR